MGRRVAQQSRWRFAGVWLATMVTVVLAPGIDSASAPRAEVESRATVDRTDEGDTLRVEVSGTISRPIEEVRAVLLDIEGFASWFPSIDHWEILERSTTSALIHGSQSFPWPMRDRDYLVLYRWRDLVGDRFTLEATAQVDALPKPGRRVIRVERMRTVWTLLASGQQTETQYLYEGDPGMSLPDWLARYRWQSHTNAVIEELAREVERRRAADP